MILKVDLCFDIMNKCFRIVYNMLDLTASARFVYFFFVFKKKKLGPEVCSKVYNTH